MSGTLKAYHPPVWQNEDFRQTGSGSCQTGGSLVLLMLLPWLVGQPCPLARGCRLTAAAQRACSDNALALALPLHCSHKYRACNNRHGIACNLQYDTLQAYASSLQAYTAHVVACMALPPHCSHVLCTLPCLQIASTVWGGLPGSLQMATEEACEVDPTMLQAHPNIPFLLHTGATQKSTLSRATAVQDCVICLTDGQSYGRQPALSTPRKANRANEAKALKEMWVNLMTEVHLCKGKGPWAPGGPRMQAFQMA
eukprot:1159311-Pelagomonas_calceolata.AAC.3